MSTQDLQNFVTLLLGHKWLPLFILVIGWLTRLLSDKSRFPVSIPSRWQPVVVLVLSLAYTTATSIATGVPARGAIVQGLFTAFMVMGLFDLLVKAVFNGNEPRWVGALALIFPPPKEAPPVPPEGDEKK